MCAQHYTQIHHDTHVMFQFERNFISTTSIIVAAPSLSTKPTITGSNICHIRFIFGNYFVVDFPRI